MRVLTQLAVDGLSEAVLGDRADAGLAPERDRVRGTFVVSVQKWLLRRLVAKAKLCADSTVKGD
jgi:hypothetical protein